MDELNFLLNASNKADVEKIITLTFISRHSTSSKQLVLEKIEALLEITNAQASSLFDALLLCIRTVLESGKIENLAEHFKNNCSAVNPKLRQLIGQIVSNRMESWREAAIQSRISLPRLTDFDWTLQLMKSSNEISSMNVPSVLMSLTVENEPTCSTSMPDSSRIVFELSAESLQTMAEGLGRIRDQLSRIT